MLVIRFKGNNNIMKTQNLFVRFLINIMQTFAISENEHYKTLYNAMSGWLFAHLATTF